MVCRRFVALGSLVIVLAVAVFVPSCTDPACADGAEGCPCTSTDDCGDLPNGCYFLYCDGTCHFQAVSRGLPCPMFPCVDPEHCWGVCNAIPVCVECLEDVHCAAGHTCEVGKVCSRCDDGVKNGDETGVDCGGSCPLCPGACNVDADCPGGYCWKGSCVSCHDGIQNGDETGIDCGPWGSHCLLCLGYGCNGFDSACVSQICEDFSCCVASCPLCYECSTSGECEPVPLGFGDMYNEDPTLICDGNMMCDGKGRCALKWGEPCSQNEKCASELCLNGKCS